MSKNNITVGDLINHLNTLPKDSVIKYAIFRESDICRKEYNIELKDIIHSNHDKNKKVLMCINI
jgi:predicted ATPase